MRLTDRAEELAAEIEAEDATITVVTDPAHVLANLPCVLVPPPRVDYVARTITWRLLVLAQGPGTLAGFKALDELLEKLAAVVPLDSAEPNQVQLPNVGDPVAAYTAQYTDTQL